MWYHLNFDIIDGESEDYDTLSKVIEKNCSAYAKILITGWVIQTQDGETFKKILTNSTKKSVECFLTNIESHMFWNLKKKYSDYIQKNIINQK